MVAHIEAAQRHTMDRLLIIIVGIASHFECAALYVYKAVLYTDRFLRGKQNSAHNKQSAQEQFSNFSHTHLLFSMVFA